MKYEKKAKNLRHALRRLVVSNGTLVENTRPCGAPISQAAAYTLLELASEGGMRVSDLAKRLSIDRTNVSRLCIRMEKSGELKFSSHPTDQRVKLVELTTKGKALAQSIDNSSALHFSALVKILGSSTPDVIDAIQLLEKAMVQKGEDDAQK